MNDLPIENPTQSYEEVYLDYEIYVQPDRDPYRGGFEWVVCRNGEELEAGLDFSIADAVTQARSAVDAMS